MAQRRKNAEPDANNDVHGLAAAERIARLLALIVVRDLDTDTAAIKLHGAGFNSREIAHLLGVGPNYLHVVRNRRKSSRNKRPKTK